MIAPFVDTGWVIEHREQIVLADVRWYLDGRSGRDAFARGHLPGAVFVELGEVLAAAPSDGAGRHPLPAPETFAAALGELGIGDEDAVVAYDDAGGAIASRLVWMLRALAHPAAVLDGGLGAWDGALETGPASRAPKRLSARPWPADRLVSIDEVAAVSSDLTDVSTDLTDVSADLTDVRAVHPISEAALPARGGRPALIDGRDRGRFRGGPDPVDPRSGHIPGARSLPAGANVGAGGRLLGLPELRQRFAEAGIVAGTDVISYCGSGVTACLNLLALEHAGLGPGRLYPGSWSQWSRDPARPIATDDVADAR